MLTNVKYYKFVDEITGSITKDYGWTVENSNVNMKIVFKDNIPEFTKNEPVIQNFIIKPRAKDAVEISEEAFNTLDTSNESTTSRIRREKHFLRVKKLQSTPDKLPPTKEEIIERLMSKIT